MLVMINDRAQFPECVRPFKQLKGIAIGWCIRDGLRGFADEHAHAHCRNVDVKRGWVCLAAEHHLHDRLLLLHEVAHLIANRLIATPWHGKEWRAAVKGIGGTFKGWGPYPDMTHSDPRRRR